MQDVNLVLADRYQARERLGSGAGTGVEEYLGRDLRLARPVVIQVIRGAGEDGFAPQARLMASLDHPAIASVYDWGQQGGLAYLIREYVPGQNLGRLLIERGVMPVAQAAAIGAEVAAALAAAHRIGLAHGSLDAADVILGDQRVTVVGFGAAWIREVAGAAGPDPADEESPDDPAPGPEVTVLDPARDQSTEAAKEAADNRRTTVAPGHGTPDRPASGAVADPLTRGRSGAGTQGDHDPQADLRALGEMLYQMVTGASPERWPVVAPMAGGALPMQLRQVIARLMATDREERYHAAEAVRADLLHLTHERAAPVQPAARHRAAGATRETAGPTDSTAPVRPPLADPPSWVSEDEPGPGGHGGPPGARDQAGRRRRGHWAGMWAGILVGLVLLAAAVAGALMLTRDPGEPATVQPPSNPVTTSGSTLPVNLPDVVGLDERDATTVLERQGFVVNVSRRPSDKTDGVVISQSPGAGERPPKGAIVFLTVSSGPDDSTIPGPEDTTAPGPGDSPAAPTTQPSGGAEPPPTTAAQASP
jgi:serine/threonine protein kinase